MVWVWEMTLPRPSNSDREMLCVPAGTSLLNPLYAEHANVSLPPSMVISTVSPGTQATGPVVAETRCQDACTFPPHVLELSTMQPERVPASAARANTVRP